MPFVQPHLEPSARHTTGDALLDSLPEIDLSRCSVEEILEYQRRALVGDDVSTETVAMHGEEPAPDGTVPHPTDVREKADVSAEVATESPNQEHLGEHGPFIEADSGAGHPTDSDRAALHRIRDVRQRQGVSLRSVARMTGCDVRELRAEEESYDLSISQLRQWAAGLDVPVEELLVDPGISLSRPVLERARMVRLMKTAVAILEEAKTTGVQRMAQTMVDQLIEIMPELAEVNGWHTVGQRRSLEELGRVAERCISDDVFVARHHQDAG